MAPHQAGVFPPQARDSSNEDRGPAYEAFLIFMTIVVILALVARFWSRSLATPEGRLTSRYWWDDWFALAGFPFALASFGLCFRMLRFGLGRHFTDIDHADVVPFFTVLFAVYFVYDTTLVLLKASALFFYARIFRTRQYATWFTWCLYATHILNVTWFLGIVFASAFMCDPIAKSWNPLLKGHCGSTSGLWLGSAIPSVIIDLIILVLPLPMIWSLKMSAARKSAITGIFVCGYCVIIVSLGRLITVVQEQKQLEADITWGGVPVLYWLCSEVAITMVSICLPATLNLGRQVASNYFMPLASRVSSIFSSRGTMSSGGFSQSSDAPVHKNIQLHAVGTSGARLDKSGFVSINDDKSTTSMDSSRRILQPHGATARAFPGHDGRDVEDQRVLVNHAGSIIRQGAL